MNPVTIASIFAFGICLGVLLLLTAERIYDRIRAWRKYEESHRQSLALLRTIASGPGLHFTPETSFEEAAE